MSISRNEDNQKILKCLSNLLEKEPCLRFIQALWALNLISADEPNSDRFYEESSTSLKKIPFNRRTYDDPSYNKRTEVDFDKLINDYQVRIDVLRALKKTSIDQKTIKEILSEI